MSTAATSPTLTEQEINRHDVIRGIRAGRRTRGNYVVDSRVVSDYPTPTGYVAVYAHREYGPGRPTFMLIHADGAKIIRSYA